MDDIGDRLTALELGYKSMKETVDKLDTRLKSVESIGEDVSQILGAMNKLGRQLRIWAPTIVGAAISAGVVNGKLGEFLRAIFVG